jgi:hypothetical protein
VPYDEFTVTPYFPYFRRGATRGMVEDLIDPQMEVNKARSANLEILSKTANGGWLIHSDGMDEKNKNRLRMFGSTPGVTIEWKGDQAHHKPEQIKPEIPTGRMQKREEIATQDFAEISGINESAMGDLDKVQSGRAIEARQRQAVLAVQPYIENRNRTIQLMGKKRLSLVQRHYNEERVFHTIGEGGQQQKLIINQMIVDPLTELKRRLNDITVGRYAIAIEETPASAVYLSAQFEEALMLLEKMGPVGGALLQIRPDLLVDMSSLPRKKEWIAALQQALGMMPAQAADAAGNPVPITEAGKGGGGVQPGVPGTAAPSIEAGVAGPGSQVVKFNPNAGRQAGAGRR